MRCPPDRTRTSLRRCSSRPTDPSVEATSASSGEEGDAARVRGREGARDSDVAESSFAPSRPLGVAASFSDLDAAPRETLLSRIFGATTPGWTPPGLHKGLAWEFYALAILLGIAAILAKASMIALPAVILLLVWWKRGRFDWRDLLAVLPLVAVGACASPIVKVLENRGIWETARWAHMTPVEKVLVAGS